MSFIFFSLNYSESVHQLYLDFIILKVFIDFLLMCLYLVEKPIPTLTLKLREGVGEG